MCRVLTDRSFPRPFDESKLFLGDAKRLKVVTHWVSQQFHVSLQFHTTVFMTLYVFISQVVSRGSVVSLLCCAGEQDFKSCSYPQRSLVSSCKYPSWSSALEKSHFSCWSVHAIKWRREHFKTLSETNVYHFSILLHLTINPSYILEFIHACIQLVQTLISTFLCDITILQLDNPKSVFIMPPPRGIKRWCCLTSVAYIGRNSRTERPRKTKIGTEVAHVTRDSDTTWRSKGQRSTCYCCLK